MKLDSIQLEKVAFIGVLASLFAPIGINLYVFKLILWNIFQFLLFSLLFARLSLKKNSKVSRKFDYWELSIILLIIILAVFTLVNENVSENWPQYAQYSSGFLLALYVRRNWGKVVTLNLLIKFALVALFIQSSVAILQQITHSSIGDVKSYFGQIQYGEYPKMFGYHISRIRGTIGHFNILGNWIIILLPFLILEIKYNIFLKRNILLKMFTLFISSVALLFTFSRGNFIIVLILCLICLLYFFRSSLKNALRTFFSYKILIYLILFFVLIFIIQSSGITEDLIHLFKQRINRSLGSELDTASFGFRLLLLRSGIQYFFKNIFIGKGFGNSKTVLGHIYPIYPTIDSDYLKKPHNIYLVIGIEGGFFALILYCFITLYPINQLWKRRHYKDPAIFAFLFSCLAAVLFQQIYLSAIMEEFSPLYMILLGASLGYIDNIKYKKNKKTTAYIRDNYS